jgi:hypothetical protein
MRIDNQTEPFAETIVEVYENSSDRERRLWAENSGDWGFQVLLFLQGRRTNEITLSEVEGTKTYASCSELEKSSLRYVAGQAEQRHPPSYDDLLRLRERDDFLMRFVAGETLGHQNWVSEIQGIPYAVARAQACDRALFSKTFYEAELFRWIWERR